MEPSLSEIWSSIAELLNADAVISGLLETPVFYDETEKPPQKLSFPAVRLSLISDNPVRTVNGVGLYRPRLQIDAISPYPKKNWQIVAELERLLEIPLVRRAEIDCDNFTIRQMTRMSDAKSIPTQVMDDERRVIQLVTEWRLKVTRKWQ